MKKFVKIIFVIISIICLALFSFSSGYDAHNISSLAYVIAIGLDSGTNSPLKLSIQLTKPTIESGTQKATNIVNSVECSSIESGMDLFNSYISRILNLSQCKVIVISEELAKTGIGKYISDLNDNSEVSPHANIIISKCSAEDFLNSSEPALEDLPSKYYDLSMTSNTYNGYTKNISLIDFFSYYYDTFSEPIATLGSINSKDDKQKLEIMGITVFKKDKLVGELNSLETICHMIISNDLNTCKLQVPNPFDNSSSIDLEVRLNKNTKNKVYFVNNTPYIKCDVNLQVKVLSLGQNLLSDNSSYYTDENVKILEDTFSQYFSEQISNYLYKVCKEYNCDIDSFGKYAVKYFPTTKDWLDYNWLDNFENSFFEVNVKTYIKSGYTFF